MSTHDEINSHAGISRRLVSDEIERDINFYSNLHQSFFKSGFFERSELSNQDDSRISLSHGAIASNVVLLRP